jgi:hypothetical protein
MVGEDSEPEKNVFRIGGNTLYDQKNIILMKIPEFKRSGIGLIAEFRGIPNRFLNLAQLKKASPSLSVGHPPPPTSRTYIARRRFGMPQRATGRMSW